jgi:hypothetical protein
LGVAGTDTATYPEAMLAPVAMLLGFAQLAPSTGDARAYVQTFLAGLEALDKGEHDAAAGMFEVAGEAEPSAPVWRVHAAVAHLRAGRTERARDLAREALAAGYPLSDLAAIDQALAPSDDEHGRKSEGASIVSAHNPNAKMVAVSLPGPVARDVRDPGDTGQRRIARGPSLKDGPAVERVHIRDSDDAVLAAFGSGWQRFDLERLRFTSTDVDYANRDQVQWHRPSVQGPDNLLRDKILDLVGIRGDLDADAVVLGPRRDHWLVFQVISPLGPGSEQDLLSVVDLDARQVLARLGRFSDEGIGPLTYWPPWYSPDATTLAVAAEWGASIEVFDTDDWTRRWCVGERTAWGEVEQLVLSLPNERRLYAFDSGLQCLKVCEVFNLENGRVLFRGRDHDLITVDGTSDDSIVVAQSLTKRSALIVLDGTDFSPLYEAWLSSDDQRLVTTVHAADGTFDSIPPHPRDLLLAGATSMGATQAELAPWLLDPLHVRSFARDTDRVARRVPLSRLRVVTEAK